MTLAIRRLLFAAALAFGLATLGIALTGSAASPFGLTGVAFAQEGDDDADDNGGDDDADDDGRDDDDGRPQGGVDTGAGGAVPFQAPGDDDGGDDDADDNADDNGVGGDDDDGRPQGGVDTGAGGTAGADSTGGSPVVPFAAAGLGATLIGGGLLARRKLTAER